MKILCTVPVYRNKWKFYTSPLIKNIESLKFNWFSCGCPVYDNHDRIIEISKYNRFFDLSSGKTYYISYDVPCKLVIYNSKKPERVKDKYCGFAYETLNTMYKRDLICDTVKFCFNKDVLIESDTCPYIEYAQSHEKYLRKVIKDFPSKRHLKNANPGNTSLKLRKLLVPFFTK